jgi:hypothetical protein
MIHSILKIQMNQKIHLIQKIRKSHLFQQNLKIHSILKIQMNQKIRMFQQIRKSHLFQQNLKIQKIHLYLMIHLSRKTQKYLMYQPQKPIQFR